MIHPEKHVPPGVKAEIEKRFFLIGLPVALLFSLGFFSRLKEALSGLYGFYGGRYVLLPEAMLPPFHVLMDKALMGFWLLILCSFVLILYHYLYYFQGSRSIYLMRRLPDRFALLRSCVSLPLSAALFVLLTVLLVNLLYFLIYLAMGPAGHVPPGQWHTLWRALL